MVAMNFHAYLSLPVNFAPMIVADIALPKAAMDLPSDELRSLTHAAVLSGIPKKDHHYFNNFTLNGIREKRKTAPSPTPAWMTDDHTKTIFAQPSRLLGTPNDYQWQMFFTSLFSKSWTSEAPFSLNEHNQGFPVVAPKRGPSLVAFFGKKQVPLDDFVPEGWTIAWQGHNTQLGLFQPSIVSKDMHNFVEFSPQASQLLSARTHPLFYVALYEFWVYLNTLPIWAHVTSPTIVEGNRITSEFSAENQMAIGLACSTFRWGWWSLMSNMFAPHSRELAMLQQYYPDCFAGGQLLPKPTNWGMDPTLATLPPRLRVLHDPYY